MIFLLPYKKYYDLTCDDAKIIPKRIFRLLKSNGSEVSNALANKEVASVWLPPILALGRSQNRVSESRKFPSS